jgi:hypothetical protein
MTTWTIELTFEAADRAEAERLTEAALSAICEGDEQDGDHECQRWAGASLRRAEADAG